MSIVFGIKKIFRSLCRFMIGAKPGETIESAIDRRKMHLLKKIDKRRITKSEFEEMLRKTGISKGDTVVIHSAWRGCYTLNMTPAEVIESIENTIGKDGLLLMPAYGNRQKVFDIKRTKSNAGVLTEVFRNMNGVYRSKQPHFSMCATGIGASEICGEHEKCMYSFDKYSPYYKAILNRDAKVILMGLDRHSVKTPIYHLAAVESINESSLYKTIYDSYESAKVIDENGKTIDFTYLVRNKNYLNDDKIFRKLLMDTNPICLKKYGFSMIVIDGKALYNHVLTFCMAGGQIYKRVISVI